MLISRLVLKNWRNFRSIDVALSDRVFIVGANASGKSNFLDALRFLRDIATPGGGLQSSLVQRGGLSKVRCLSARKNPDVELEISLSENDDSADWRYAIGLTHQAGGLRLPVIRYERAWHGDDLVLDRPDKDDKNDKILLTQTHLEQISANSKFRDIAKLLESIRYLHLVPQLLRKPEGQGSSVDDPFGRGFLEAIARTPEKTRKARLRKIAAALKHVVPQMKDLTDTKDKAGGPHLEVLYEHWRPAIRQTEDQFSDGTIRLIGIFWSLLDGDSPLLLEEPELSLNSAIVKRLPSLFYRLQKQQKGRSGQVFVTTHSWELLSDLGIGAEEVILLTPSLEGTKAQVSSERKEVRAMLENGLSIAEAALPFTAPPTLEQFNLFQ
jgi:predicted ATPase